MIDMIWVF